jgi:hypothetical protein
MAIFMPVALTVPTLCPQRFPAAMQAPEGCKAFENIGEGFLRLRGNVSD